MKDYPRTASKLKDQDVLPSIPQDENIAIPEYISRTATSSEPIPHVCLKVPISGGKDAVGCGCA